MRRVVLIGEAPQYPLARPGEALAGRIGDRLASLAGISRLAYLRRTRRLNLYCDPPRLWRSAVARQHALDILRELPMSEPIVLCGRRVAGAFGVVDRPILQWYEHAGRTMASMPHPSGRNRWWNESQNVERAAVFLRETIGENAPMTETQRSVDEYISNVESLLLAIDQRSISDRQMDRLAIVLQQAETRLLNRAKEIMKR